MNSSSIQRLSDEVRRIRQNASIRHYIVGIIQENFKTLEITYIGQRNLFGRYYRVKFSMPDDYPQHPPVVEVLTPLRHPNVRCRDNRLIIPVLTVQGEDNIFEDGFWNFNVDLLHVVQQVSIVLHNPLLQHPVNETAANLYRDNNAKYERDNAGLFNDAVIGPGPSEEVRHSH